MKPWKKSAFMSGCSAALIASVGMFCSPAIAQDVAADAAKRPAPDAESGKLFDETVVVVTGTSGARKKLAIPYSISTISSEKIAQIAPHSVTDLLKATPGITVEASGGEGGGENVVIRGLPWSGWRLIDLNIDGMPVFESNTERFMNADEFFRVNSMTSRAEVVRGGTAPIYSNNASGGVVNFITRHGTEFPEGAITVQTGSANRIGVDGYWSGPVTEHLTASVGGSWRTDNGLRDPGFSGADKGGQVSAGATYKFEKGKIFGDVRYLNDRAAFYTSVPLTDPRAGATFGQSLSDVIDPRNGTLTSSAFQNVNLRTIGADGNPLRVKEDLADGIHPNITMATLGGNFDLGSGWAVSDTYRHTKGSVLFNGIFNGAPSDSTTLLNGQLAGAAAAFPTTTSVRYVIAGTNTPWNAATSHGLVMANNWNSISTKIRFDANDIKFTKAVDTGLGTHNLTFGGYLSSYSYDQTQLLNSILTSINNRPQALDIQALDASGNVVGQVTENGFLSYGSGSLVGSLTGQSSALYFEDAWHVTPKWELDFGVRSVGRRQKGFQGVLGVQNQSPTGPLAARNVRGAVSYIPHSENLKGTSTTFGTAYIINKSNNVFLRYTDTFSYPRFDTILLGATLPGGTTPLPVSKVKQGEVGWKYAGQHFQMFAVAYYSKFDKLNGGTQVVDSLGNVTTSNILFNSTSKGLELETVWTPSEHFELSASGMLQDPIIDSVTTLTGTSAVSTQNKDVPRVPRYQLTLEPAYKFTAGGLDGRVYASIFSIGKRYQDFSNLSILPAYTSVDLGLSLKASNGIEARLLINNLTDVVGLTEGNARASAIGVGTPGDATVGRSIFGRNFTASVTKRW